MALTVSTELKRAGRDQDADALYREEVASAGDPGSIATAATLAASRGDVDGLLGLFDAYERLEGKRPSTSAPAGYVLSPTYGYVASPAASMAQVMYLRADAKAHGDILRLLDRYLASLRDSDRAKQQARSRGAAGSFSAPGASGTRFQVWLTKN